jgi:modulator of FtsH protease
VTAYDIAQWGDFANTVGGAAAALAGLLFVGLSLNLSEVLSYPGVATRAGVTVGMTVALMVVAVLLAAPGQSRQALAFEFGAIAVLVSLAVLVTTKRSPGDSPYRLLYLLALPLIPMTLLMVGAVSLWLRAGGGLYWVTAAIVTGLAAATANSWVLVVEIKR